MKLMVCGNCVLLVQSFTLSVIEKIKKYSNEPEMELRLFMVLITLVNIYLVFEQMTTPCVRDFQNLTSAVIGKLS